MDSKRIQKNIKTLQNIISSATYADESSSKAFKWPSKIKHQCKKESLNPIKLDFDHPHYIYLALCMLLGGELCEYENYIVDFQRYISDNSNLFELCMKKCDIDYELGTYIETLEEKSVDDIFEFIFLLSLFPSINCFTNMNCEKCKKLCTGYIDQRNNQSTCICRKSQIMMLRVLYEKQGALKQKNIPIESDFKGVPYEEVDSRERISIYIYQGKIVPLVDCQEESSSEDSIDLINDDFDEELENESSFKEQNRNQNMYKKMNLTSKPVYKDSDNLSSSQIINSDAQKSSSTKIINNLNKNDFKESVINRTFNDSNRDRSLNEMSQTQNNIPTQQYNNGMYFVPLSTILPPPGFETHNQQMMIPNNQFSNIYPQYPQPQMNPGMMYTQPMGYPTFINTDNRRNLQSTNPFVKKSANNPKGLFKPALGTSMNKSSKAFQPKISSTQKSFRDSMLNKTQIHVEDLTMMNKSQSSEGDSIDKKESLSINPSYQLSQSMIQGRLSPLNLDASRFEKEEIAKETTVTRGLDSKNEIIQTNEDESTRIESQRLEQKEIDPSMTSASPNSNSLLKDHDKDKDEDNDDGSSYIMYGGKVFTGVIKFFNQKNQFGFILQDEGGKDIFFHYEDIKGTMCPKKVLRKADKNCAFKVSYQVKFYIGKNKNSQKAINIKIESMAERI